ncbi:MAG: hypothetical protein HYZ53_08900 [Planctomycetes bacterium]|nr:hypothetical protein [Planctomycetota bacterium]
MELSLLVLKTDKLEETKRFYEHLGVMFVQEKHGDGPLHYSAALGDLVLEICPGEAGGTRLGFEAVGCTTGGGKDPDGQTLRCTTEN